MSDNENPMASADTISQLLRKREDKEKQAALLAEEVEEYKGVVNRLFSSPDGIYFLNKLLLYTGQNTFDTVLNPAKLVEDNGKRKVWLELIRPYLHPSTRQGLDL